MNTAVFGSRYPVDGLTRTLDTVVPFKYVCAMAKKVTCCYILQEKDVSKEG